MFRSAAGAGYAVKRRTACRSADILRRCARTRLLSVRIFRQATRSGGQARGLPRDQVDHPILALSRGVTSGNRPVRGRTAGFRDTVRYTAHTVGMPVRLHHIVVDAHDLPALARFWTQALGWKVLSERENEIVIGTGENSPVGMCFMPVNDPKTVKNRVHLDLTSSAADRDQEIVPASR
jgi:hypothetical protein